MPMGKPASQGYVSIVRHKVDLVHRRSKVSRVLEGPRFRLLGGGQGGQIPIRHMTS